MKSIPLTNPSRRLGAPSNWNHETDGICHTLDIWDQDGAMVSGWQPSAADMERLQRGEPLFLHIWAAQHPVVGFSVGYARQEPVASKCECGKPDNVSCHNPDCARPA